MLKKALAAFLCLTLCLPACLALAEQPQESPWLSWLKQGADLLSQTFSGVWESLKSAWNDASTYLSEAAKGWAEDLDAFFREAGSQASDSVNQAWATLREAVKDARAVAPEKLNDAYQTLRKWMIENNASQGTLDSLDGLFKSLTDAARTEQPAEKTPAPATQGV